MLPLTVRIKKADFIDETNPPDPKATSCWAKSCQRSATSTACPQCRRGLAGGSCSCGGASSCARPAGSAYTARRAASFSFGDLCPEVSTFEGSRTRARYFGFDPKTDLVANPGTDEYWIPMHKVKSLPSSRTTRDGARWISVGVGQETEIEISFAGQMGNGCIVNCAYDMSPRTVAEVVTRIATASGVAFKIKGKAEGEASLKVICQGKTIGWLHIWCKKAPGFTSI